MFVTICSTSSKANGYKFSEIHASSDSLQVTVAQPKTELASVCVVPTSEVCSVIGTKIKKIRTDLVHQMHVYLTDFHEQMSINSSSNIGRNLNGVDE